MYFCCVYAERDQTSQFHPVRRAGSGFPWFCWDAAFMWKQSPGPFSPSVVTEDNEIHNICHLLALFGVTDLLLIRGLLTRVQLRSWNEADGSHGLSGAAAGRPVGWHVSWPSPPQARHTEARCLSTTAVITKCCLVTKALSLFDKLYSSSLAP